MGLLHKNEVIMRKFIALSACLTVLLLPSTIFASQNLITETEKFYHDFEASMSSGDYKTTLMLFEKYVAEDFGHYDDGQLSYGKERFREILIEHDEKKIKTDISIDMKDVTYSDEKNEVLANFVIHQDTFKHIDSENEKKLVSSMTLDCIDSLRVLDTQELKLYKCDCKILKKIEHHNDNEE